MMPQLLAAISVHSGAALVALLGIIENNGTITGLGVLASVGVQLFVYRTIGPLQQKMAGLEVAVGGVQARLNRLERRIDKALDETDV